MQVEIKQVIPENTHLENEPVITINELQCQISEFQFQFQQLNFFNSILGSTFCYYLWEATQIPIVIDMVLQGV